jgi:hypothetical protein
LLKIHLRSSLTLSCSLARMIAKKKFPRNPLRRPSKQKPLPGMRVCSNITACCLPAVLADLHVHDACLGCQLSVPNSS